MHQFKQHHIIVINPPNEINEYKFFRAVFLTNPSSYAYKFSTGWSYSRPLKVQGIAFVKFPAYNLDW